MVTKAEHHPATNSTVSEIVAPIVAWTAEHDRLDGRLQDATQRHSEAVAAAEAAMQTFEDNTSDDPHVAGRLRAALRDKQNAADDFAAGVRGAERALAGHEASHAAAVNQALTAFAIWFDGKINTLCRRYALVAETAADIVSEALTLSSVTSQALPRGRGVFSILTLTPFTVPKSLLDRSFSDGDFAPTSLRANLPEIAVAARIMEVLAPAVRQVEAKQRLADVAEKRAIDQAALTG